jgi:hypothetical protein
MTRRLGLPLYRTREAGLFIDTTLIKKKSPRGLPQYNGSGCEKNSLKYLNPLKN